MRKLSSLLLILLFSLFFYSFSYSKANNLSLIYQNLLQDFSPLSGVLIDHEEKGWVIDKGRAEGVKKGDLWEIYQPYPTPTLIGILEVVETEKHFSFGKVLEKKGEIKLPSLVKRLTELKIGIIARDKEEKKTLINFLKEHFPKWQVKALSSFPAKGEYNFVFVLEKHSLKVYDTLLTLVRTYGGFDWGSIAKVENPWQVLGCKLLGKIPIAVLQAEFYDVDKDEYPELIYLTQKGLFVIKIKGGLLAYYVPVNGKPLSFSTGPDGWIALNLYAGKKGMKSEILKLSGNGIVPVVQDLDYILEFVDWKETGSKDTLLAQSFDPKKFFRDHVYILQRKEDKAFPVGEIKVPENFEILGSAFADLDGDGKKEVITFLPDGKLGVFKNNHIVWESPFKAKDHFYSLKTSSGEVSPVVSPIIVKTSKGKTVLLFSKVKFPLNEIKKDLTNLPLNYATSKVLALGFEKAFFTKELTLPKEGFITGMGIQRDKLFFLIVKDSYPDKPVSELYYCEF